MIVRSKAPLRLGLAGGGTDVDPYAETFGGCVLNATISMYVYVTLVPRDDGIIELSSNNTNEIFRTESQKYLDIDGNLDLVKGVYNRLQKDFDLGNLSFSLSIDSESPPGSGLGSSSTLVVAIIGVFTEWLKLPLGRSDIANLSYLIERKDLEMAGGKQDQYSATFGGVNFMEFGPGDKVVINPLSINKKTLNELSLNLLLYSTGQSRFSSTIISHQSLNVEKGLKDTIEGMHSLKANAIKMKNMLQSGQYRKLGELMGEGWLEKKKTSSKITNKDIEKLYSTALTLGAKGGKISGAGGGGFMMLYCEEKQRRGLMENIKRDFGNHFTRYEFVDKGLETWEIL